MQQQIAAVMDTELGEFRQRGGGDLRVCSIQFDGRIEPWFLQN
jgi:hypothetical protein